MPTSSAANVNTKCLNYKQNTALVLASGLHCFDIKGTYDPTTEEITDPAPASIAAAAAAAGTAAVGAADAAVQAHLQNEAKSVKPLASLDIFAGCGGLSEGMHQVRLHWILKPSKIISLHQQQDPHRFRCGEPMPFSKKHLLSSNQFNL
jgi:hypothetical protein